MLLHGTFTGENAFLKCMLQVDCIMCGLSQGGLHVTVSLEQGVVLGMHTR